MRHILIIIFSNLSLILCGQNQYAGEDQVICGGNFAVLGIENPNPQHCYLWAEANGLELYNLHSSNPQVWPEETTTYSVTVTDQQFSFKAVETVKVTVTFGVIEVDPKYIKPNGEENQAQAGVLWPDGNPVPVIWSIEEREGAENCSIDGSGFIGGCTTSGWILIRATNASNMDCWDNLQVNVNHGVKELIIRELPENGREASSLKEAPFNKLRVTTINQIEIRAIPNDETGFLEGQPEWSGDLLPEDPHAEVWTVNESQIGYGGVYSFTAGDQTAKLEFVQEDVPTYEGPMTLNLGSIVSPFIQAIQRIGPFFSDGICTGTPSFNEYDIPFIITRKWVEAHNDPRLGKYVKMETSGNIFLDFNFGMGSNCTYLSRFGKRFDFDHPIGHVYLAPYLVLGNGSTGLEYICNIEFDPSNENAIIGDYPTSFTHTDIDIEGDMDFLVNFGIVQSLTDGPYQLTPTPSEMDFFAIGVADMDLSNFQVKYNASWGGLQFKPSGQLYIGSPSNPTWSKSYHGSGFNIMDGRQSDKVIPLFPPGVFNFD